MKVKEYNWVLLTAAVVFALKDHIMVAVWFFLTWVIVKNIQQK